MAPTMSLHHVWFQTHKALWTRFLLHRGNTVHMIFQCLCLLLLHCTRPTVCRHHTHFKEQYSLSQFSYSIRNYWKVTNTVSDATSYVLCYKNMSLYCLSLCLLNTLPILSLKHAVKHFWSSICNVFQNTQTLFIRPTYALWFYECNFTTQWPWTCFGYSSGHLQDGKSKSINMFIICHNHSTHQNHIVFGYNSC
jgi:hypothetical protein